MQEMVVYPKTQRDANFLHIYITYYPQDKRPFLTVQQLPVPISCLGKYKCEILCTTAEKLDATLWSRR
jgi:hypothetical protein